MKDPVEDDESFIDLILDFIKFVREEHHEYFFCDMDCVYDDVAERLNRKPVTIKAWALGESLPHFKMIRRYTVWKVQAELREYAKRFKERQNENGPFRVSSSR